MAEPISNDTIRFFHYHGVWYARVPTYYLLPDYLYFQIVNGWQTGTVLTLTETIKLKMTTKFGFVAAPFFYYSQH